MRDFRSIPRPPQDSVSAIRRCEHRIPGIFGGLDASLQKASVVVFVLMLFCPLLQGQQRSEPVAKLVHRYEYGCGYSCAQEVAIDLGGMYAAKSDDRVAVRFCSKEPLPVALTTAAAAYAYVNSILEGSYGYTAERVLFLRSEDCLGPDPAVTATEFWAVPKGATAPTAIETMTSNRVRIETIPGKRSITSRHGYREALKHLQERLATDPEATGIVIGSYYKSPNALMERRLSEARQMLSKSGLPQGRYFVRLSPWTGEYSLSSPEPKYPSLFVVKTEQ
jgi:hypothetical protein